MKGPWAYLKCQDSYQRILLQRLFFMGDKDVCHFCRACITVKVLSIGTDRSEQTAQQQIRLLLIMEQSDQDLHCFFYLS